MRFIGTAEARQQLRYWQRRLADASAVSLPTDRPRPPVQTFRGAIERFELPADLANALRDLSRRESVTLFMTTLAAFAAVVGNFAGEEEVCLGSAVANRRRREAEPLIGMIVNTVVLRLDLGGDPRFRELLARVRSQTLNAYANQDLPFDAVVEAVQPVRDLSYNPLFQIAFSLHDSPLPPLEIPGGRIELADLLDNGSAKFDLNVIAVPRAEQCSDRTIADGEGITLIWEYNTDLFDRTTMQRLAAAYRRVLQAAVEGPNDRLSSLTRVSDADRLQIRGWSSTPSVSETRPAHHCVEEWALRTPDAVAILGPRECVTYKALDERAVRLAHVFGPAPGTVIGVAMSRSSSMVAGVLAAMKAGAAYLPIDPSLPAARVKLLVEDAGVSYVLADAQTERAIAHCGACVINADDTLASYGPLPARSLTGRAAGLDDAAYVIYTSGSTGMPKGVMVSHRGLTNVLRDGCNRLGVTPASRVYAVSNISFDMATLEIWLPLVAGACCWLAEAPISAGDAAVRELSESAASIVISTPAAWRALLDQGWRPDAALTAVSGGEAFPPSLAVELCRSGASVWILYGPTEITVYATAHRVQEDEAVIPIGRPVTGTSVHVLDARLQPVPIGAISAIPVTSTGMVDVKRLPAPVVERAATSEPHRTPAERRLEGIWREVLGLADIGRGDDFFDLGGHSLAAMQVTSRVWRDFGVELPLRVVFERSVLADMAEYVEAQQMAATM